MSDAKPSTGIPLPESLAGNFQDAARWFNQLWSNSLDPSAARGAAGMVPSMMMPTLDIKELEKRIADLRSVEQWLQLNQGMLRTTIQALEMQRSTLAAWQELGAGAAPATAAQAAPKASAGAAASTPEPAAFQPALWWAALQEQFALMASNAAAQAAAPETPSNAAPAAPGNPAAAKGKPPGTGR
jgi:hypothetical protein